MCILGSTHKYKYINVCVCFSRLCVYRSFTLNPCQFAYTRDDLRSSDLPCRLALSSVLGSTHFPFVLHSIQNRMDKSEAVRSFNWWYRYESDRCLLNSRIFHFFFAFLLAPMFTFFPHFVCSWYICDDMRARACVWVASTQYYLWHLSCHK